jgi:hypothetical protein
MRTMTLIIAGSLLVSGASATPVECAPGATPLLILGTFHMEGSDQDAVKAKPGDMTTPRRQREIAELVDRLSAFRPTRVAVESSRISSYWNERYAKWRQERGALGENEIEQLGFRVADAAGLESLSPVDYPMWMDGTTAADRHDPRPQSASAPVAPPATSPLLADLEAQVAADLDLLSRSSVSEYLVYLNSPARAVKNQRWDVLSNLAPGAGTSMYETTDYATYWYKRNLRIYTNLVDIAGPSERILLIIGAGHKYLLDGLASDDPRFCVADVAAILGAPPGR